MLIQKLISMCLLLACCSSHEICNNSIYDGIRGAALSIMEDCLYRRSSTFVLTSMVSEDKSLPIVSNIITFLMKNIGKAAEIYVNATVAEPRNFNVLVVDDVKAFKKIRDEYPITQLERNCYIMVLLTKPSLKYEDDLLEIFESCWYSRVVNVIVVLHNPSKLNRDVHIYTYYPFTEDSCRKVTTKLLSVYKNCQLEKIPFFPDKMLNFHRCPLRIAAREYPPFMIKQPLTFSRKNIPVSGIEGLILWIMAHHYNFTIEMTPEPEEATMILKNFSSTGILALIDHGMADLAIGGLSLWTPELGIKYSYSETYFQSPAVLVVRKGVQFGPIEQLLEPFDHGTWLLNLVIYLAITMAFVSVAPSKGWLRRRLIGKTSYAAFQTNFLALTLGYSITTLPKRFVIRSVIFYWLLYSFFMRSAYQGVLFDSIRKNYESHVPASIEDLIKEKYEIISATEKCSVPTSIIFNETKEVNVSYKEIFNYVQNNTEKVAALALLDQLSMFNYVQSHGEGNNLTYITEMYSDKQIVMIYPKQSFLRKPFNALIRRFQENGMIALHANVYANRKYNKYNINYNVEPVITGNRLLGLFAMFLGMLAFSILTFIAEIVSHKYSIFSKFFNFVHYSASDEEDQISLRHVPPGMSVSTLHH